MLIVDRQKRLLEILQRRKSAQFEEMAEALGVSASTVRRDLDLLQSQGLVETTRGGAVYRNGATPALDQRMAEQVPAKQIIGRAAAALVHPEMTLFLDGGTTMFYTAQQITARPLQIITNSLTIASHFANDEKVELLMLGGLLYPRTGVLVGAIAAQSLKEIHADLMLFSVAGVYEGDAYNSNLEMAFIEKAAMRRAARKILLVDSNKFGRKSLAHVCRLDELDQIVTDDAIAAEHRAVLGPRLLVAG